MRCKYRGFEGEVYWDGDKGMLCIDAVEKESGATLYCESLSWYHEGNIMGEFKLLIDEAYEVAAEQGDEEASQC